MGRRDSPDISRREFVATLGASAVAAQGLTSSVADGAQPSPRPNILFIISDQHREDCMGVSGNPDIRTPTLDALAADGVRHASGFCPYPACTPSRYSLLSGLDVNKHKGWTNRSTLHPELPTFPKLLRDAGYRTAAVGKMHMTPTYLDVGFERMVLAEQDGDGRWDDDYHRELMALGLADINDLEDQVREFRDKARPEYWETCGALASNLPLEHHSTEWTGRQALKVLDEWEQDGNLLYVSFIKPHHPFDPPRELQDRYDPQGLTLPPGWTDTCFPHDLAVSKGYFPNEDLTETKLRRIAAFYYATIEQIDQQIGRMAALLKEKGLYDNTVIVYCSDHGEYLGYHHMLLKANNMYEPLVKVPLIIKYPGNAKGGTTSRALVSLVDLAPTLLAQAGCAVDKRMSGVDLFKESNPREVVFSEGLQGKQIMASTEQHKLLLTRAPGRTLFYDLEKDPFEREDRSGDPAYASVIAWLTEQAETWQGIPADLEPHRDLDAPVLNGPNVPKDLSHRPEIESYYRMKAREALGVAP